MEINEISSLALEALKGRKVRTILTIVMVVVGSSLMVSLFGLSAGFAEFTEKQLSTLAPNVLFVSPAEEIEERRFGGNGPPPAPKVVLTSVVADRINNLPTVRDIIEAYRGSITLQAKGKSMEIQVFAMDPQKVYVLVPNIELEEGSIVRSNDPAAILLSYNVAYPAGEAFPFAVIGQTVQAKYSFVDETGEQQTEQRSFIVRGIMGITGNPTVDNAAIIPLDTGNSLMHRANRFDNLIVLSNSADLVEQTETEIRSLYGKDIGVISAKAILKTIQEFTSGIAAFILSIALVALLVGAIGIITTLYTSVTERTREIGTMKAIGAQDMDILRLFLSEAVMIGFIGASIGLAVGIVGGYLLVFTMVAGEEGPTMNPVFRAQDLAMVWVISIGLSALAGLYPARKASKLPPIEALRHE